MNTKQLKIMLQRLHDGECEVGEVLDKLKHWPAEKMDFACLDHHRSLRTGFPEVVYGENKSAEQIAVIMKKLLKNSSMSMATRVHPDKAAVVCRKIPELKYHETACMLTGKRDPADENGQHRGIIAVLSAGTSDIPIAEEAAVTASFFGNPVKKLFDVGVAGIHRLLGHQDVFKSATVIIVVAGMEGALPSVVGGLVDKPIIAVPTSIGYGTGFGGFAALLGMLNSCSPGVAVVNIDNGFGAGCMAAAINRN